MCREGAEETHIFLGLLDSGRDLDLCGERLILAGVDLVFSEHWQRRLGA
jgi:hypothetical protein